MRNPLPAAVLSAILSTRNQDPHVGPYQVAALAARICRLGKQSTRYAVCQCNGEAWPGQHDALCHLRLPQAQYSERLEAMQSSIEAMAAKLQRSADNANAALEPFGLFVETSGDPRGHTLGLYAAANSTRVLWSI